MCRRSIAAVQAWHRYSAVTSCRTTGVAGFGQCWQKIASPGKSLQFGVAGFKMPPPHQPR
jgi:hypothetical protein